MAADYHKRIRLDLGNYRAEGTVCSVTIAVRHRQPVLGAAPVARPAIDILTDQATVTGVAVYAYCIMPDHVHLVLSPSATCDIVTFVGQFKNLAQRVAWRLGVRGAFWQKSFWDHFLRKEEDLGTVVEYVLGNPVRAGLVDEWQDYRFSGSLVFDIRPFPTPAGDEPPRYDCPVPNPAGDKPPRYE